MFDDTLKFVGLLLGSSVISTLLTQVWSTSIAGKKEKESNQREAGYAALQISTRLESFAIECINFLVNYENEQVETQGCLGEAVVQFELPPFLPYPSDIQWKFLDGCLAAYALSFPNEVELSRAALQATFDEVPPTQHISEAGTQVAYRGYRAVILASKLRAKYELPAFYPRAPDFDFVKSLRQRYKELFSKGMPYRHPFDDDLK